MIEKKRYGVVENMCRCNFQYLHIYKNIQTRASSYINSKRNGCPEHEFRGLNKNFVSI